MVASFAPLLPLDRAQMMLLGPQMYSMPDKSHVIVLFKRWQIKPRKI